MFMKQYVIDELRPADFEKVKDYLRTHFERSEVDNLFWVPVNEDLLTNVQRHHKTCQPFYVAVDLEPGRVSCELLVRTRSRVRCDCIQYATEKQRNWLISLVDSVLGQLEIIH